MNSTTFLLSLGSTLFLSLAVSAAEISPFVEGELSLTITSGQREEIHLYRVKGDQLRIDRPGEIIPSPPVNIIDLKSGLVTILHPHNGTSSSYTPSDAFPEADTPGLPLGMPQLPPGIGPQSSAKPAPEPEKPARIGPDPSKLPGVTEMRATSETPDIPELPDAGSQPNLPPQIQQTSILSPPPMPAMPPMLGGPATAPFALKATGETQEIHGYPCSKHTMELHREGTLTLWLTKQEHLFPFHTLSYEGPNRFGRQEWQDQVSSLLHKEKLFPLLLTLTESQKNDEPAAELARWEVTAIKPTTLQPSEEDLFLVPASYQSIDR